MRALRAKLCSVHAPYECHVVEPREFRRSLGRQDFRAQELPGPEDWIFGDVENEELFAP